MLDVFPLRYTDPTGHYSFEEGPDDNFMWRYDSAGHLAFCATNCTYNSDHVITMKDFGVPITQIDEPKPDFFIAVPWSKEFGDRVSTLTNVGGVVVSSGKTIISGVGVFGYSLGPLGGIASSNVIDQIEDWGDWVTLGLDIGGEFFNGDTRTAFEKNDLSFNYRVTLILGQDVSLDLLTMGLDRAIPGATFDLVSNVSDTAYGVVKLTGNMPNRFETRISAYESPFLEVVIYGPSVDE